MPHALASVCARGSGKDCTDMLDSLKALAAGGFRDTTRVSMGKPSMWAEILMENGEEVLAALDTCAAELDCLRNLLRQGNRDALKLWLQGAGDMRRTIMHPSPDESGLE